MLNQVTEVIRVPIILTRLVSRGDERVKDRVHFLTQASAGFVKRPKMVLWGSGKLKTMFFDDFEQYEKIEFVDFLYGHIFFYVKKIYLG